MLVMILGLVIFLAAHSISMVPGLREGLHDKLGEAGFKIGYSVASLVGIVAIAYGFGQWKYVQGAPILYVPPTALKHLALLLMFFSFVALAAMYGTSHIRKILKHPMLVGIKIWAFAHLLANGDAAGVTLFGAFLVWAVADRISVKRRERAGLKAAATFEPTVRGDIVALAGAVIIYALFVWEVHLWLIGVSPIVM